MSTSGKTKEDIDILRKKIADGLVQIPVPAGAGGVLHATFAHVSYQGDGDSEYNLLRLLLKRLNDEKENTAGQQAHSVRERLEEHRANPACSGCHKIMDPLGFAMENFDAVGRWRTTAESGSPIDASGELLDGTKLNGPASLRNALSSSREDFALTVTGKLLTYALGRGAESFDMPAIRRITRTASLSDYRWSALILGIVRSQPFQMRMPPQAQAENTVSLQKKQP